MSKWECSLPPKACRQQSPQGAGVPACKRRRGSVKTLPDWAGMHVRAEPFVQQLPLQSPFAELEHQNSDPGALQPPPPRPPASAQPSSKPHVRSLPPFPSLHAVTRPCGARTHFCAFQGVHQAGLHATLGANVRRMHSVPLLCMDNPPCHRTSGHTHML